MTEVKFKKLSEEAIIPTKAHETDSGFDLYATEDVVIYPGETKLVSTGIAADIPEGFDATVRPRSGNTSKTKLRVQLGTVDNAYTGEIKVIVDNGYPNLYPMLEGIGSIIIDSLIESGFKAEGNLGKEVLKERVSKVFESKFDDWFFSKVVHTLKPDVVAEFDEPDFPPGTYIVRKGDKIAQLVLHPYYASGSVEADFGDKERGANGFGSTGTNAEVSK